MNCDGCSSPYDKSKDLKKEDIPQVTKFIKKYWDYISLPQSERKLEIEYIGGEVLFTSTPENIKEIDNLMRKDIKVGNSGIQTNLILSKEKLDSLQKLFPTKYSTSYNFNKTRKLNNSFLKFKKEFKKNYLYLYKKYQIKIPIIVLISNKNVKQIYKIYKLMNKYNINVTFRHFIPIGEGKNQQNLQVNNEIYSKQMLKILKDKNKKIIVEPLHTMINISEDTKRDTCYFQTDCYKNSININSNGNVYTCSEFEAIDMPIGNWKNQILNIKNILKITNRSKKIPDKCQTCEVLNECKAGCIVEGMLENNNMYEETFMCSSWKTIYKYIKTNKIKNK